MPRSPDLAAELVSRVDALDPTLFSLIDSQTSTWDRRALLALEAAAASVLGSFSYLEVGSYRGGSLQVVIQDPRCSHVVSIDPRPPVTPDNRSGSWIYEHISTCQMIASLRGLPLADMSKLTTFELGTDVLESSDLPVTPDYCFIDGEHTDAAVLRDARFCADAIRGSGVIAFHDYGLVGAGVRSFTREVWSDVSDAVAFVLAGGGGVFALELGGRGLLRQEVVSRAVASGWHSFVWGVTSRFRRSPEPFLAAWSTVPVIDAAVVKLRRVVPRREP